MATAQEAQEKAVNRGRVQALIYRVSDKVWLSLENITTDRPSKKLDAKYYNKIEPLDFGRRV